MLSTVRRYAVIESSATRLETVQRYMPGNYFAIEINGVILIVGTDNAGWSLDEYVIPRLASGLIYARELVQKE